MAHYFTDFGEHTTGQAPSDWTFRYNAQGGETLTIVEDAGALSGKLLRMVVGWEPSPTTLGWDAVNADPDTDDVELLMRIRFPNESGNQRKCGMFFCGDNAVEDYYTQSGANQNLQGIFYKYEAGSPTSVIGANTVSTTTDTWYWVQVRRNGNTLKMRAWEDGSEKFTTWRVDTTDSTHLQAGWLGLIIRNSIGQTTVIEVDQFSVGTAGDRAFDAPEQQLFWEPDPADLNGAPAGWTNVYGTTTLTVKQDGASRYYLEVDGTSNTRSGVTLDTIDGVDVSSVGDVEMASECYFESTGKVDARLMQRFSGTSNADAKFRAGGGQFESSTLDALLTYGEAGSLGDQVRTPIAGIVSGDTYFQRVQSYHVFHKARVWEDGTAEPSAWDAETTSDTGQNDYGKIGLFRYWTGKVRIYGIGVGLGGADAPLAPVGGGGPTPLSISGTIEQGNELTGTAGITLPASGTLEQGNELTGTLTTSETLSISSTLEQGNELTGTMVLGLSLSGTLEQGNEALGTLGAAVGLSGTLEQGNEIPAAALKLGLLFQGTLEQGNEALGTLRVLTSLSGTLSQATELTGTLSLAPILRGTLEQGTEFLGTMTLGQPLTGTLEQGTEALGTLRVGATLSGVIAQGNEVLGTLTLGQPLSGTLEQGNELTGDIGVKVGLSGTLEQGNELTGNLLEALGKQISGTLEQGNELVGTLRALVGLEGSIEQGQSLAGTLVAGAEISLVGTIEQGNELVGYASRLRLGQSFLYQRTDLTGTLYSRWAVEGTLVQGSELRGTLSKTTPLSGTFSQDSLLQGNLTNLHPAAAGHLTTTDIYLYNTLYDIVQVPELRPSDIILRPTLTADTLDLQPE